MRIDRSAPAKGRKETTTPAAEKKETEAVTEAASESESRRSASEVRVLCIKWSESLILTGVPADRGQRR